MSFTDYLIDGALVAIVLLQIKWRPLSTRSLLRPVVIVAVAVVVYFHSIPTAGNDLPLILVLAAVGALIGLAAGQATWVRRREDGIVESRAGWLAAFFWVLGMGLRFAFLIWINTSAGGRSLTHFSVEHSITGSAAWTDAVLGMAVLEVVGRSVLLALRRQRLSGGGGVATATA